MGSVIDKALSRSQGLVWGDYVKDSSLYFEGHTLNLDVMGTEAGTDAFRIRGLDPSNNAPTDLFAIDKDGTFTPTGLQDKGGQVHNVKAYGAVGNGSTNDATAIAAAITAASAGDVIFFPRAASYYRVTSAITVSKALTFVGERADIRQVTSNTALFVVTASDVAFVGLKMTGPQGSASQANESAVTVTGASAASPYARIRVLDCRILDWGQNGVYLKWVTDFEVRGNLISNVYYAGVAGECVLRGRISDNEIDTVNGTPNAYGIYLSRPNSSSLVTEPRSADVVVSGNVIRNVTVWEGIDTHGGQRITIVGNTIHGCEYGVVVTRAVNASAVATYAPLDCQVIGNSIDSGVTDGTATYGILVAGAEGTEGSSVQHATGIAVVGNTIRGHGDQATATSGGIYCRDTKGLVISGNTLIEPSPHGITLDNDNYGASVVGNTVIDPWTTAGGEAVAFYARNGYNTGFVGGLTATLGTKTATRVLDYAIRVANTTGNLIELGSIYTTDATRIIDAGLLTTHRIDAKKIGFFSVAAVARPTAYTQTYATADKTLAAPPAAITGGESPTEAEHNALRTFAVDTAEMLNAVIDDLQAMGLLS